MSAVRTRIAIAAWVAFAAIQLAIDSTAAQKAQRTAMQLTSTAFAEGEAIPARYTCDEQNVSPPLKWSGAPQDAKALVLVVEDPDAPAGTWTHWLLYDLPPGTSELPEDVPKSQFVPGGAKQGLNDFKRLGYGGPCPPKGKPHRYFFHLFALDAPLELKPGASKKDVERAMEKHIVGQGQLMGTYTRK